MPSEPNPAPPALTDIIYICSSCTIAYTSEEYPNGKPTKCDNCAEENTFHKYIKVEEDA